MKNKIVKGLLASLMVGCIVSPANAAYLDEAEKYLKAGDDIKAVEFYELAIKNNEDKEQAYIGMANVYAEACDYTKARNLLDKALDINPKSLKALLAIAAVYGEVAWTYDDVASYKKGLDYLKQAKDYHPEEAASIDLYISEFNAKIAEFPQEEVQNNETSEVQKILEVSDETYSYKIAKALEEGNVEQGLKLCDEAIAANQDADIAYMLKAGVLAMAGDMAEAMELVNKSLEINPNLVKSLTLRAALNAEMGNFDIAILDYDKAIEIEPQNADLYMTRAKLKYAKGDKEGAAKDYVNAEQILKGVADVYILE